jgi:hypothetical protein
MSDRDISGMDARRPDEKDLRGHASQFPIPLPLILHDARWFIEGRALQPLRHFDTLRRD